MARRLPSLSDIPESQRTDIVLELLEIMREQKEELQALRDEIARLKGQKARPKIRPSTLESKARARGGAGKKGKGGKRPGSNKREKTSELEVHETVVVAPAAVPEGSRFKGYQHYTVQELVIGVHTTRYSLERWQTPAGDHVVGKLPAEAGSGHFGPTLVTFVLYQYYHAHVTQPLLLELLGELGIDISAGQVNRIITEGKERFHAEKDELLRAGLEVSSHVHVDDTGARHQGRNAVCTHIGNELFAWFETTGSKSRINFLELLRADHRDYVINDEALKYMRAQGLPAAQLAALSAHHATTFKDDGAWAAALKALKVTAKRHVRIATEGALVGSVLDHGFNPKLVIVSDDAGQFNVFLHALCWIHAERTIHRLVGFTDFQRDTLASIRTRIWDLYDDLKRYRGAPNDTAKEELGRRFDELFTAKTGYASLDLALGRLHKNKRELLLVLERPEIPLHNNLSERDIRDFVKKRKISGSTHSDLGRRCRDTFASLKKTCRKLEVSFWDYLLDRGSTEPKIPRLAELLRQRAGPLAT